MLLRIIIISGFILALSHGESVIFGQRESCSNEGEEVKVDKVMGFSCFACICKNGFVECQQEKCPITEGCYQLVQKSKNGCCSKCKGCVYKGVEYGSYTEWSDPLDPCRVFRCEAGVITESRMQCYTPCSNPTPPAPGTCCSTCNGCRVNGQRVTEERDVTVLEDPCIKCHCESATMTCSKRACPVLQCPVGMQYKSAGECCPVCRGVRTLHHIADTCILGRKLLHNGDALQFDKCTQCQCENGTSLCERPACPVLECLPEYQVKLPGDCCPHCQRIDDNRTQCVFNGVTYQNGESWQLDPCKSCMCHHGELRCAMERCPHQNMPCPPNHKLVHQPGQCCPKCVESDGVCTVFGDPHYKTFDGKFFSFQGSCKYQLAADCVDHSFSIRVTNDGKQTKSSAWTKTICIKMDNLKINLGQKRRVKVNGQRVSVPFHIQDRVVIERLDDSIIVSTNIGIKILWDGTSFLEISAATKYKGRLCGLCGNYDDNVKNDLRTRKGAVVFDNDIWKLGASWRVGGRKACARTPERPKEKICTRQTKWLQQACLPLLQSDKFANCDKKLNPNKYFKACTMDMCECPTGRCFCEAFTAYAHECRRLGVNVPDWRSLTNCYQGEYSNKSIALIPQVLPLMLRKPEPSSKRGQSQNRRNHLFDSRMFLERTTTPANASNLIKRGPPPPLLDDGGKRKGKPRGPPPPLM